MMITILDWAGLEPAILSEYGPEPYAYANSATGPKKQFYIILAPNDPTTCFWSERPSQNV